MTIKHKNQMIEQINKICEAMDALCDLHDEMTLDEQDEFANEYPFYKSLDEMLGDVAYWAMTIYELPEVWEN